MEPLDFRRGGHDSAHQNATWGVVAVRQDREGAAAPLMLDAADECPILIPTAASDQISGAGASNAARPLADLLECQPGNETLPRFYH